jgi:2-dehydropantoate 2-reductase
MSVPVAIVGGGAMGGAFANAIAQRGTAVVIVDPAPLVVEAIARDGLRVTTGEGDQTTRVDVTPDAATVGVADVVLVFVKAAHTRQAASALPSLIGERTVVVTLQNGWGNADVLADHVPTERLVMGVTYHSATVVRPGQIRHTGRGMTFLGPYLSDADPRPAHTVADLLEASGLDATVSPNVRTEIWKKLVLNAATLPVAALTGLNAGQLGEPGPVRDLVDALATEATRVGRAMGFEVELDERIARIHAVLEGAGTGKPSMLQDVEGRRLTEIDVISGAIARLGAEAGVDAALARAMTAMVHGLERSWPQSSPSAETS